MPRRAPRCGDPAARRGRDGGIARRDAASARRMTCRDRRADAARRSRAPSTLLARGRARRVSRPRRSTGSAPTPAIARGGAPDLRRQGSPRRSSGDRSSARRRRTSSAGRARCPTARATLAAAFWPGPLTLDPAARAAASDVVTGGQDSVGLRVPSHPVARALLAAFGGGIAAPSANRFGRISPTTARARRRRSRRGRGD